MATAAAAAKAPARAPIDCVPSEFCCMLSGAPMRRPVVAADGLAVCVLSLLVRVAVCAPASSTASHAH